MFIRFSLVVPFPGIVPKEYNPEYEKEFIHKDGHWSIKYGKKK